MRRSLGACILRQLGWGERTFLGESVDILLRLLSDVDAAVVAAAAYALGFRSHAAAIPALLGHVEHPDPAVRLAVVRGLSGHDHVGAIGGLIQLLGTMIEMSIKSDCWLASMDGVETPELRDALIERVSDQEAEIRGEALIGLASRRHPGVAALVTRTGPDVRRRLAD